MIRIDRDTFTVTFYCDRCNSIAYTGKYSEDDCIEPLGPGALDLCEDCSQLYEQELTKLDDSSDYWNWESQFLGPRLLELGKAVLGPETTRAMASEVTTAFRPPMRFGRFEHTAAFSIFPFR